ncbi:MAG: cyclic nucleotide-binding domain-containing protein [Desulfobacteraceae bacterium]|nr:cyclic nucleotide-binding domain-containing protein [Desulfobacteraceae bacterium]
MSSAPTAAGQGADLIDFISNLPLFENLDPEGLSVVKDHMSFQNLQRGEIFFNEWDRAEFVCFIESGSLDVMKKSGPETYSVLRNLRRGQSIGEMCLIENFPRSATVKTHTDTRVAILKREGFDDIVDTSPAIAISILKNLARMLSQNLKKTRSRLSDYMLPLD